MVHKIRLGPFHVKLQRLPELGLLSVTEPASGTLLKAAFAEFVCMTLFIFVGIGTVVFGCHSNDVATNSTVSGQTSEPQDCFLNNSRVLTIAAGFGFAIWVFVYASAAFSGGHLNPAVTWAFLLTKKVSLVRALMYWFAQLTGAILGAAFVKAVDQVGFRAAGGGSNRLLAGISPAGAWLLETILTFVLVFVVFCASDKPRAGSASHLLIQAPAAIGFAVFIANLTAVAIDGCSINPARSFGPAVVSGAGWTHHWLFWVGPLSGATLAALTYEMFFRPAGNLQVPGGVTTVTGLASPSSEKKNKHAAKAVENHDESSSADEDEEQDGNQRQHTRDNGNNV